MALTTAHRVIERWPYAPDTHWMATIIVYHHENDFSHSLGTVGTDDGVPTPESTGDDNLTVMGYEPPAEWIEVGDGGRYAFAVLKND